MSETRKPSSLGSFVFTLLAAMGATTILLMILEQFDLVPTGWRLVATGICVGVVVCVAESLVRSRRTRRTDYSR